MKDRTTVEHFLSWIAKPSFILFTLVFFNLVELSWRYGNPHHMLRWESQLRVSCLILIAASALLVRKEWGYLVAIILTSPTALEWIFGTLKVYNLLPGNPPQDWETPALFWRMVREYPMDFLPILLAATILMYALICLGFSMFRKRRVLP
jgi:hypothetical protein